MASLHLLQGFQPGTGVMWNLQWPDHGDWLLYQILPAGSLLRRAAAATYRRNPGRLTYRTCNSRTVCVGVTDRLQG